MNNSIFGNSLGVIAPHPDDEVLGCGGLITKKKKKKISVSLLIVSGHLPPLYKEDDFEITRKEALEAANIMGISNVEFLKLPATFINQTPINILNSKLTNFLKKNNVTSLALPFPDRHVDHKLIFEAGMVVSRPVGNCYPNLVFCYETLSETSWNAPNIEPNFIPDMFIDITDEIDIKKKALESYNSQISNNPSRDINAVDALAKYRGSQNGFSYAESFKIIRCLVD